MNHSLLICIAAHYNPERTEYLETVVSNFLIEYGNHSKIKIIIDTNSNELNYLNEEKVTVYVHINMEHPFNLTCMHKRHIKERIDFYDVAMYIEDDILLPYSNYLNYLENFIILYPKYVPSFIRIEQGSGSEYVSDVINKHKLNTIYIEEKQFASFPFPEDYQGFWIMPTKELKPLINDNFTKLSDFREQNAMFPQWVAGKTGLVEIEHRQVSVKCFAYHLPNNYINSELPNAKIKANEIFIP